MKELLRTKRDIQRQKLNLIACVNKKNALGKNGELLYRFSQDFEWFKMVTTGGVVVMGVKTYLEIGKPLPGRINIVVADPRRPEPILSEGIILVHSLEEALSVAGFNTEREVFVIGGASLYQEAFTLGVDYIYRTKVQDESDGDVFFIEEESIEKSFCLLTGHIEPFESVNQITGETLNYRFEIWKHLSTSQQAEQALNWLNIAEGRGIN